MHIGMVPHVHMRGLVQGVGQGHTEYYEEIG